MSVAEASTVSGRLAPLKEWSPLFPSDWVELAFDPAFRVKRLSDLRKNQVTVATSFYFMIWTMLAFCLVWVLIPLIGLLFDQKHPLASASTSLLIIPALTMLVSLVFIGINYLKTEIERTLLQIIDRLAHEEAEHVR